MNSKKLFRKIHHWLGLYTAPLVFFVCITGTIFVFSDEIIDFSAGEARYVKEVKNSWVDTEELINNLKNEFPDRRQPSYMVCYRNPNRSVRFNSYSKEDGLRMVYMDPYTGEILKDDGTINFFYVLAHLHNSLLMHDVGPWIIDVATIIFIIALITGLVLWWPKKWDKKNKNAAFTIKWKASKKRLNFDLHKVFGFYALGICLVISITGLLIAFKPFASFTKNAFGGNAEIQMKNVLVKSEKDTLSSLIPINDVIDKAFVSYPSKQQLKLITYRLHEWDYYSIIMANKIGIKSAMNAEYLAYDKITGSPYTLPEELIVNERVEDVYWSLHLGNYMGLFGKTLTFLGGLIASMLTVTGFIIWLNKQKGKKNRRKNAN